MNFKTIKRAEELRLNIVNQDKEIIELEKIMQDLALNEGQTLALSLSVTRTVKDSSGKTDEDIAPPSLQIYDTPQAKEYLSGIYGRVLRDMGPLKEQILNKVSEDKKSFALTNSLALEFLQIYRTRLYDERALAYKLLEECVKSLKVLD